MTSSDLNGSDQPLFGLGDQVAASDEQLVPAPVPQMFGRLREAARISWRGAGNPMSETLGPPKK
jgi:hypothetical protein